MKEIKLSQGKVALVDDADYDWLNQWKWHACKTSNNKSWTARRKSVGKGGRQINVHMHREILSVVQNGVEVDHKDGDTLNNQRHNLRACSRTENIFNTHSRGGTSKHKGVCYNKSNGKWAAQIAAKKHRIHIGYFDKEEDAAMAYNTLAKKHHGEFAKLNTL